MGRAEMLCLPWRFCSTLSADFVFSSLSALTGGVNHVDRGCLKYPTDRYSDTHTHTFSLCIFGRVEWGRGPVAAAAVEEEK